MATKYGGWAGKVLRVNLTTGEISSEDTMKYKPFIGGMGIGTKVMFDEVPLNAKAYDEANKIIFAVGPLTGTGAVMSSRTTITSLSPTHGDMITESHMGGHWGPMLKYAGWDAVIIEGKSPKPVWLRIENDKVTIEDARWLWGHGIYRATAEINNIMGAEAVVAAIGQAGENMVNMSVIMNSYSHSAGGHGGVMGSKNLKAIGVKGTLPIQLACDKEEWRKLDEYALSLVGSNNQAVVPRFPQPWSPWSASTSRWWAKKGLYWGAANPPVETGVCHPEDTNSIGYRCHKGYGDHGAIGEKYTTRMGGCSSCPIRCHAHMEIPQLEHYGYSRYVANTCMGWSAPGGVMIKGNWNVGEPGEAAMVAKALGKHLCDDYGVWCNYGQIGRDFRYAYESGILKKVLPEAEYNSIPWDKLEKGDPAFLLDFYRRIAFKEGEFSRLGEGSMSISKAWNFGEDYYGYTYNIWNRKLGFPKHHSNETNGQVGALTNLFFNRDSQHHTNVCMFNNGLPLDIKNSIIAEFIGHYGAVDAPNNYTPINIAKVKFAKYCILTNVLHDSLTLCNWVWPLNTSPHASRNYRGDWELEAKYYSAATGDVKSMKELLVDGERIMTLHRCYSVLKSGSKNMRKDYDLIPDWAFDYPKDAKPFTPGTNKLDRADMEKALDMYYEEWGWDPKTGIPTKETLLRLGLADAAARLEASGQLPG